MAEAQQKEPTLSEILSGWFKRQNHTGIEFSLQAIDRACNSANKPLAPEEMQQLIKALADRDVMLEALELLQGFDFRLDDSPHGKEIRRRAVAAIDLAKAQ